MIKYLSHCIFLVVCCAGIELRAQDVNISIDHPERVRAGEEFTVSLLINKGSLTDYSRFSQDLPLGLTATNLNSPNADFSFDNQRVRIIWLKLPDEEKVNVSYKIQVDRRLKGTFFLGGVFAYVVEDERNFLNVNEISEITIVPNPDVDPELIVDIKDFRGSSVVAAASRSTLKGHMVVRQKPVLMPSGAYRVRLLVKNPENSKYAKIEETIPGGYLFEEVNSNDGIVSYAASTVKFIWMKLPDEPEFEVVYDLIPQRDETQEAMNIEGEITYTSENETLVTDVVEMDVALEELSSTEKREILTSGNVPDDAKKASELAVESAASGTSSPRPAGRTQVSRQRSAPAPVSGGQIMGTPVLQESDGLYFRVQLSANEQAFNARTLFRQAGVDREITVEQHEGLYKYTAGPFRTYNEAISYRDRVEALEEVEGSFVVAYRDGSRIPVSAATQ